MHVAKQGFSTLLLSSQRSGNIRASASRRGEDREHGDMSDNVQVVNKPLYLE